MKSTGDTASAALSRAKGCCGHYTTVMLLATAMASGALGVFFGMGYWDDDDGRIVFGSLGIFFAFCWGLVVRYANVPWRFREHLPWTVKQAERVTAWSSQCFLIFSAAAIINEKVLLPLVTCTNSRQSTGLIATVAFFGGSVALPEPTHVNSLVANLFFLLSVVLRNYNDNSLTLYAVLAASIGVVLFTIRYYASHTKVFTRQMNKSADQLYNRVVTRDPGISKVKIEGYKAHVFWDLCHHLNISWAVVFSLYYMIQGWEESLDLHETKFWIPLVSGIGAMLLRFMLHRMFWGRLKREMQLDDVSAGMRVFDVKTKEPAPTESTRTNTKTNTKTTTGTIADADQEGAVQKKRGFFSFLNVAESPFRASQQPVKPMGEGSAGKVRTWRTTPTYKYERVYAQEPAGHPRR